MKHIMDFEINGRTWSIIEGTLEQGKDFITSREMAFQLEDMEWFGGYTEFTSQTIFVNNKLCYDAKIYVLLHELGHCYIQSYIKTAIEVEYTEEIVCDLLANSHYIIHNIVEKYKEVLLGGDKNGVSDI